MRDPKSDMLPAVMDNNDSVFVYTHDGSYKFYGVKKVDNLTALVQWGRIGTIGRTKKYPFRTAQDKMMEKLRKGYVQIKNGQAKTLSEPGENEKWIAKIEKLLYRLKTEKDKTEVKNILAAYKLTNKIRPADMKLMNRLWSER